MSLRFFIAMENFYNICFPFFFVSLHSTFNLLVKVEGVGGGAETSFLHFKMEKLRRENKEMIIKRFARR